MVLSFTLPENYGYVVLGCCLLPFIASSTMGAVVMQARKDFNVPYPNLYATPGFHKQADEFNRVQRGHQSLFETLTTFTVMSLIGGIKHPIVAALGGLFFSIGNYCFLLGYADTKLDVAKARYQKGGILKVFGILMAIGTAVSTAGSMNNWW